MRIIMAAALIGAIISAQPEAPASLYELVGFQSAPIVQIWT
ncbi:MAG: hypothetical protein ACR2OV_12925 [Hyphomicrobiaceae bacterium]